MGGGGGHTPQEEGVGFMGHYIRHRELRREIYRQVGGWDESVGGAAEWDGAAGRWAGNGRLCGDGIPTAPPCVCVLVLQVHDWSCAGKQRLVAQLVRAVLPVIERGDGDQ